MTQVFNRLKFEEIFEYELKRSKRYGFPFVFAIMDIDHFKQFNDEYGHFIGDEVLTMMAQQVNMVIRESDTFARWGGEEFAVLFTAVEISGAYKACENIRQKVSLLRHPKAGEITISIGLTEYREGDTLQAMYERSDQALYKAKNNGRNRIEVE